MKTYNFIILISLILLSIQVNAQFSLGLKGGYTNSFQEYGDVELPEDAKIDVAGYNYGIIIDYKLNQYMSLETSPSFIRRGAACMPGFIGFSGDSDLLLSYIDMPVALVAQFPLWKAKLLPFLKLGYGGSVLVKAEERIERTRIGDPSFRITDITDNNTVKKIDHGINVGLGIKMVVGINTFLISLDHYRGIPNAEKSNVSKNRSLSFNFGLMQSI